ncbi:MAG: ATPase [Candidatus Fischerbacteria bacterium RBG_13_37_8]|uniref:ATPase n=1 Tax=Candidatus Fischerbacteria bacterium RBG_13_37_8 TaxID=1817863 RepID=A0A1F5V8V0_9BACT|nr:MAG: ATPase [Candidatus Fischerbacteria bacterium RBG_13_37_8]
MYSRLIKEPENKSFFLFGPRGTGKTTWVKNTLSHSLYIDLLEAELFNDLLAHPQRLENFIPKDFSDWIVIDEIQRIPELLHEVHRLIETHRYKFVLTGSSARKLRRGGYNLLAGRALTYAMHPLASVELGKDFDLEHSLKFGFLPCVYTESDPKRYLESYVKTYLEEEIRQEGLTRNLGAFARFLEAASFSQGSVLNISEVARECAVERKVVENYFAILEDLLIGNRVPVFFRHAKRRLVAHSKFYFFDTGIYRTIRPAGPLDQPEQIEGAACETVLFQELMAINDALNLGYKIYYWKTSQGMEVDFVVYGEKGLKVFEIKRTHKLSSSMYRGLRAFLQDYPMAEAYFIYGGERYMRDGDITIIPMKDFYQTLPSILTQQKS